MSLDELKIGYRKMQRFASILVQTLEEMEKMKNNLLQSHISEYQPSAEKSVMSVSSDQNTVEQLQFQVTQLQRENDELRRGAILMTEQGEISLSNPELWRQYIQNLQYHAQLNCVNSESVRRCISREMGLRESLEKKETELSSLQVDLQKTRKEVRNYQSIGMNLLSAVELINVLRRSNNLFKKNEKIMIERIEEMKTIIREKDRQLRILQRPYTHQRKR